MKTAKAKIPFSNAGYYFFGLAAIVLLGFWHRYFSELIAGTSHHASYFHFHGIMAMLWLAILIVQPILIRKRKFNAHRFIGKLSYVVMPLLIASVIMINHYEENMLPESGTSFINVMAPVIMLSLFYIIAIWKRHKVNIHARAMIVTGFIMIPPAAHRFLFEIVPNIQFAVNSTSAIIYILLIALIIAERKAKSGRWVFPLFLCIQVVFSFTGDAKIPVVDPAFGKWFRQLPLTNPPLIVVKDLPVPTNEIDQYTGEWELNFRRDVTAITYKKENQLWIRYEELKSKKKIDSTRLLYQGDNKFIVDKNDEGFFLSPGPAKHYTSLYFHLRNGKAESFTPYYGFSVFSGYVKRVK